MGYQLIYLSDNFNMITERQEKLLDYLIKEYISTSEPVSSFALKKSAGLDISPATVRNDLQELTKAGYVKQPHTSAGRVPTKKAYKHFVDKLETTATFYDVHEVNIVRMSIVRQIKFAHEQIEQEIMLAEEIMRSLEQDNLFKILNILDTWHRKTKN